MVVVAVLRSSQRAQKENLHKLHGILKGNETTLEEAREGRLKGKSN